MLRWSLRPRSFFSLVLLSFCLAVAPLIVALASTHWQMDRFFAQSVLAVYRAARASEASQILLSQVKELDRSARQYHVLADAQLWESYVNRRTQVTKTLEDLEGLADSDVLREELTLLKEKEHALFALLEATPPGRPLSADVEAEFLALSLLAGAISAESRHWIDAQVLHLSELNEQTQRLLLWQALAIIAGTVFLALLLSNFIARPVRQLDHAIRGMGDGRLDDPVVVRGPRDLHTLGERLNWLRQRLLDLEEKKGNFLRHVSHELKTPLTALREGSALLAEGFLGQLNRQQREVTEMLQRNALALQRMIENLLSFNMVEARKSALEVRAVNLRELIDSVVHEHKLALLARKINLQLNCEPLVMEADREKLRTVIDNLLSNAVKYSPDQGLLRVALSQVQGSAVLDVEDQGPGIRLADANRVFEAFYRGDGQTGIRGSGLGLAIAKEFVDLHGGAIAVVPGKERGAHFRVTLPLQAQRAAA